MNTPQNIDKELAIKGAEALGYRILSLDFSSAAQVVVNDSDFIFDPANNANDRDRLVEHFKISVEFISDADGWRARNRKDFVIYEDRTTAIKMCLCKILEIDYA